MYNFTVLYTCRYIYLFIFFIIINCDMSHVLEINYLILSYLITCEMTCHTLHAMNVGGGGGGGGVINGALVTIC